MHSTHSQTLSREEGRTHGQVEVRPHIQVEDRQTSSQTISCCWRHGAANCSSSHCTNHLGKGRKTACLMILILILVLRGMIVLIWLWAKRQKRHTLYKCVPVKRLCVMNSALCGENVNCAHTQLQLWRKHKLWHSFCIGFGNQSKNAISLNWSQHPKRKGLLEQKQESRLKKVVHSAKTHPLQLKGTVLMTFVGRH